jgi:predicted metalloprotease with PDZ domain
MSYQAPFADAATSIDPNNRGNTFISYYSYGEIIGLALDLTLRNMTPAKSLDEFMQFVWKKHGKVESPYHVRDIQAALGEFVSPAFANAFFDKYIHHSELPDFKKLFESMGLQYAKAKAGKSILGAQLKKTDKGIAISSYTKTGSPVYKAGLESGDIITQVDGITYENVDSLNNSISRIAPGKSITINFKRLNAELTTKVLLVEDPNMQLKMFEDVGLKPTTLQLKRRTDWLSEK